MTASNSSVPNSQLAKLKGANATSPKYPFIAVDGQKIDFSFWNGFSDVKVEPGVHTLTYYTYGYRSRDVTYRLKKQTIDEMKKKGDSVALTLENIIEHPSSKVEIEDHGIIGKYGFHYPVTCDINFEPGKSYGKSRINQAIRDAGCKAPHYAPKLNLVSDITNMKLFIDDNLVLRKKCALTLTEKEAGNEAAIKSAYEKAGCGGYAHLQGLTK